MKNVTVGHKYQFRLENVKNAPTMILPLKQKLPGGKCVFEHERLNVTFTVDCSQVVRSA
jgi:hypothetical protein